MVCEKDDNKILHLGLLVLRLFTLNVKSIKVQPLRCEMVEYNLNVRFEYTHQNNSVDVLCIFCRMKSLLFHKINIKVVFIASIQILYLHSG